MTTACRFGPFRFDGLLYRDGVLVPVPPKALETLRVLLERHGTVVDKAELIRLVWPDTTVEEIGVARNISILRKALGGDEEGDQYIETIPKKGYRFVADVSAESEASPPPRAHRFRMHGGLWAALALALFVYWQFFVPSRYLPPAKVGLAVSPFDALDANQASSALARGLTELVAAQAGRLEGLHVVSPTTVHRYRRFGIPTSFMARVLGVQLLVEGTTQSVGDRLRLTARLVDVHTGRLIWSDSFDYDRDRVADAQMETARQITASVEKNLKR